MAVSVRPVLTLLVLTALAGCGLSGAVAPTPTPSPAPEIVLYAWADELPPDLLDQFTAETGIRVRYETYNSQEQAEAAIRSPQGGYDVVKVENQMLPALIADGQLAELNLDHIPNFRGVSPNFRDLAIDPGNQHSIPSTWGTVGLIVRSDLVTQPVTRWADLWEQTIPGTATTWTMQRYTIGMALKALGYSVNSEDPAELDAARAKLLSFKEHGQLIDYDPPMVDELLLNGDAPLMLGWPADVRRVSGKNPAITYVLPEEGAILWGDVFVVPAASPHVAEAEQFLDFLLRPEVNAAIVNFNYYATVVEAAYPFIKPAILNDPTIFPPNKAMEHAEILMPLSPEGQQRYDALWQDVLSSGTTSP